MILNGPGRFLRRLGDRHPAGARFFPPDRRRAIAPGLLAGLLLLGACSPALNWRRIDLEGPGQALFPCKPEHRQRPAVMVAGEPRAMRQSACEAQGMTFAVTTVRLETGPAAAGSADRLMQALAHGLADNIGAAAPLRPVASPASGPGAGSASGPAAEPAPWQFRVQGRRADGGAVGVDALLLSRGAWLIQAAVVAPSADPAAVQAFFDGLQGRL